MVTTYRMFLTRQELGTFSPTPSTASISCEKCECWGQKLLATNLACVCPRLLGDADLNVGQASWLPAEA